ncbi:MAG: sugar transferase related protein [uncultured bacterium]|nr:MAG: sugar transferase related protein [uncultured bacterium]OGH13040.1 MAG: hypothetical protein A2687_04185 [Candidatus Levybacteria bacterium RIFCSPHIGHO2_01_FULL_38_26]
MKISFVATVFNEEKTIGYFLDSLFKQTKIPDEIIIIDGGSADKTVNKIKSYPLRRSLGEANSSKIKILVSPNSTIAQGRNIGIEKASGEIIAMSDAGCILHKDWLEKITKPFIKDNVDIVAGFYRMTGSKSIQKALALYLGIPPKRFDQNKFLPSARSIAFSKSIWKKVGGFDEKLERAGEDTIFNYLAIKIGAKFYRVKDALVDWEVPKNLWDGFKKFYIYVKGDIEGGIWWHPKQQFSTHNIKILSVFARYITGGILLVFAFQHEFIRYILIGFILAYLAWPIWKTRDIVTDFRVKLWLPVVQISSDIAIILGAIFGIIKT